MWQKLLCTSFLTLLPFFCLESDESRYQKYLDFIKDHKYTECNLGCFRQGEIEIVKDIKIIKEIEDCQRATLLKRGYTKAHAEESSRIGILTEDEYWMWIRDAVIFPTGAKGTYNRIVLKRELSDPVPRVAMLPVLDDGKLILNLNYRHALRKWVLEVPRGFKLRNESDQDAVKRQLKEETGYDVKMQKLLGNLSPDSGCLGINVPVYLVEVGGKTFANQDFTEAILRNEILTIDVVKKALADGFIVLDIYGRKHRVDVCDSYLAYAILMLEAKKSK